MNLQKGKFVSIILSGIIICFVLGIFAQDIIVETRRNGQNYEYYREQAGNWQDSVAKSDAPGVTKNIGSRMCDYGGEGFTARAMVSPVFPQSGIYEVFVTWSQSANLRKVKYIVNHANGQASIYLDQDGWGGLSSSNKDIWLSLGKYEFNRGTGNNLLIDGSETMGPGDPRNWSRIYTDAFRFVYLEGTEEVDVAQRTEDVYRPVREETREAEGLSWHSDLQQAINIARQENRRILIYFYTPQAQLCREYDRYFNSEDFQSRLRNYVLVRIDLSQNIQYSSAYSIYRVPAIIITNSQGVETSRITRPLSRTELLESL